MFNVCSSFLNSFIHFQWQYGVSCHKQNKWLQHTFPGTSGLGCVCTCWSGVSTLYPERNRGNLCVLFVCLDPHCDCFCGLIAVCPSWHSWLFKMIDKFSELLLFQYSRSVVQIDSRIYVPVKVKGQSWHLLWTSFFLPWSQTFAALLFFKRVPCTCYSSSENRPQGCLAMPVNKAAPKLSCYPYSSMDQDDGEQSKSKWAKWSSFHTTCRRKTEYLLSSN